MYKLGRFSPPSFLVQALVFSALLIFIQPAWSEDFNFPGLSGTVTVTEDQYGIPTIKGDKELDVVFVQGYLHARDRFFQMDRDRKGAAGRAAEMFGASALASDVQTRTLGLGPRGHQDLGRRWTRKPRAGCRLMPTASTPG